MLKIFSLPNELHKPLTINSEKQITALITPHQGLISRELILFT